MAENQFGKPVFAEITVGSVRPEEALAWLYEMNDAKSYHDLINSTSKNGHNFATLDMKIANSLWRTMPRDLRRQVSIWDSLQEKTYNKMLNGRQLAWIIFDHFKMPEVTVRMFRLQDLMNLKLRDDSLAQYNFGWDEMLAGVQEIPAEDVMDALYSTQIQRSTDSKIYGICTTMTSPSSRASPRTRTSKNW